MKELERPEHNQTFDNYFSNTTFHTEINKYCDQLESSRDELIKDNVKSEDHLYRKLLGAQKERDGLKKENKKWKIDNDVWMKTSLVDITEENAELKERKQEWKDESDRWYKDFGESQQELQTLKEAVNEFIKYEDGEDEPLSSFEDEALFIEHINKLKELIK